MCFSSLLNFLDIKQIIFLMIFSLCCLSNNVNGHRSSKKRVKMFEYFTGQIVNGILFLQETHSSEDTFNKWWDNLEVFFRMVQQVLAV